MASLPKRIVWDACAWIALIQKEKIRDSFEKITEDREQLCRSVLEAAKQGKFEVVVSSLCLVEVCKAGSDAGDKIGDFFESDFILVVSLDQVVARRARELMQGSHGLKPPDASHIATALVTNADELHTFDDRMLSLDGKLDKVDGTKLKIRKPGPPDIAPLFRFAGTT